ncbi:hypothetical protein PA598K_01562 [Paenibacillus sp. 598K]|nr:hypothetical protein PA598K_01562 [Paenibacillus sp. 598K]
MQPAPGSPPHNCHEARLYIYPASWVYYSQVSLVAQAEDVRLGGTGCVIVCEEVVTVWRMSEIQESI